MKKQYEPVVLWKHPGIVFEDKPFAIMDSPTAMQYLLQTCWRDTEAAFSVYHLFSKKDDGSYPLYDWLKSLLPVKYTADELWQKGFKQLEQTTPVATTEAVRCCGKKWPRYQTYGIYHVMYCPNCDFYVSHVTGDKNSTIKMWHDRLNPETYWTGWENNLERWHPEKLEYRVCRIAKS